MMQLCTENLEMSEQLAEFDQWLTARLERIKDSEKFNLEIKSLCDCIQAISPHLNNFSDYHLCSVDNLCDAVISASNFLIAGDSFTNLLFLTSGATDNNLKNHFLIKLKNENIKPLTPKKGYLKKQ